MKPKRTPWRKLILLPAFMIFLFAGLCVFGEDLTHYQQVYQNPLVVTATVTHHTADTDSDDDTYYEAFLSYTAQGKEYTNVFYEGSYYPEELPQVGETFSLSVSPQDPSQTLSDLYTSGYVFLGVLVVFSLLFGWFMKTLLLCLRTKEVDDMEPEPELMQKHALLTVWSNLFLWASACCLAGCGLAYWKYAVPLVDQGLFVFVLVSGVILICTLLACYPKHGCITREEYTLRHDVLIEKREDSRSDDTTYYLIYQTSNHTWRKVVSYKKYYQAKIGETVHTVFLPKQKKPLFFYDENWNIS